MKQVRAVFHGHVQGVGFRYMTLSIAAQFSVTGYVKNLANGCVELKAEGNEAELKKFMEAIQKSHLQDHIRSVDVFWENPQGQFQSFEIAI